MTADELREGLRVIYVPYHAHGNTEHPDSERGLVSSWVKGRDGRVTVFVRYSGQHASKATDLTDLVPA